MTEIHSSKAALAWAPVIFLASLFLAAFCSTVPIVGATGDSSKLAPIRYTISLAQPEKHIVHVIVDIPPGAPQHDLQLPVWNALYQVRDFSQYIYRVRAEDRAGHPLLLQLLGKSRWRVSGAENGAEIQYEIFADNPGPYGAQFNEHHAFFNLAEILMYPADARSAPVQLSFTDIPAGWKTATALSSSSADQFDAGNYDLLVDAPVEIGTFAERDFEQGGGHYRVVVDADSADYDMDKLVPTVRSIVTVATAWMNDRPFDTYLFLYHFPRAPGGGGMEHSYSTAIDVNTSVLTSDPQALTDVTAHEFFHLWNVKRIRPQALEPVDYTKENYTTALWFSEGVTNTVQDYICLQAGLLDESHYLTRLASEIGELERRPAHLTQSAEEASLDAWLEKYPAYLLPVRSISYYNKGDLLGVLLDLAVRNASHVIAEPGFWAVRNSDAPPVVTDVDANGAAAIAGLVVGDSILEINGRVTSSDFRRQLAEVPPGDALHLLVQRGSSQRKVAWKVGSHEDVEFELKDLDPVSPQQRAWRAAWLSGNDQTTDETHP